VVAVQVRERPSAAVLADMIDGVIVANRLSGSEAGELRDQLWHSVTDLLGDAGPPVRSGHAEVTPIRAA
jgi:hypothetical protein